MIEIFKSVNHDVTKEQIKDWAKKDDDPDLVEMRDSMLAAFLNGFIIEKRGRREGPLPVAEIRLNNNDVLRKFKIALNLKDTDILDLFKLSHTSLSKHELSSFFRKKEHRNRVHMKDQFLRNFFHGMQARYRDGVSYD